MVKSDSRAREAGRVDRRYDSDFDTVSRGLEARDGPPGSVWSVKRIGILTAGGDAPGLNAAIRAAVRSAIGVHGLEVVGFLNGWAGVIGGETTPLTPATVQGILHRGGTILGSSGTDPYHSGGIGAVRRTLIDLGLEGLVAIGGEGTMTAAAHLAEDGLPLVGVPKTIDND